MSESEYPPYTFAAHGQRWSLEFNHGKKNRIKAVCGVDLSRLIESKLSPLETLSNDRDKLMEAVWVLVEEQAKSAGLDKAAFCDPLSGPELDAAESALTEAAILFSPPHHRDVIRGALKKGAEVVAKVGQNAVEKMDVDSLVRTLTELSGSAQGS